MDLELIDLHLKMSTFCRKIIVKLYKEYANKIPSIRNDIVGFFNESKSFMSSHAKNKEQIFLIDITFHTLLEAFKKCSNPNLLKTILVNDRICPIIYHQLYKYVMNYYPDSKAKYFIDKNFAYFDNQFKNICAKNGWKYDPSKNMIIYIYYDSQV
jgi:hypothetical protein